jgi:hypothetical protein
MENQLSTILNMDSRIIYVGSIDKDGNILDSKSRAEVDRIFSPEKLRKFAAQVALQSIRRMREEWDSDLGKVVSTAIIRNKVTVITFYVGDKTFMILFESGTPLRVLDPMDHLRYMLGILEV